ncbi:MAG: hypothetical protein JNL11_07890 [Bdellovibrionaceae bacterium]|nr:hypothetical protein [Pseudobdellovibrionaceae bacterium]
MEQYFRIKKKNPHRKIILIGHSRGGLVALQMLVNHPQVLEDNALAAVVAVQSPIKGTPTAQFLYEKVTATQAGIRAVCRRCSLGILDDLAKGARSMDKKITEKNIEQVGRLSAAQVSLLNQKLFYVASYSSAQYSKLGTYIINGKNDGTVPTDNQYIVGVGRLLAVLPDVGHTDLFFSGLKSGMTSSKRRVFAHTLMDSLIDPRASLEAL